MCETGEYYCPGPGPFLPSSPGAREAGLSPRRARECLFLSNSAFGLPVREKAPRCWKCANGGQAAIRCLSTSGVPRPEQGSAPQQRGTRCQTGSPQDLDFWGFPSDATLKAQRFPAGRFFSYRSVGGLVECCRAWALWSEVSGLKFRPRPCASDLTCRCPSYLISKVGLISVPPF